MLADLANWNIRPGVQSTAMVLKSAFIVLYLVAKSTAQVPSAIPACGVSSARLLLPLSACSTLTSFQQQTCISNMIAIANTEFGCPAGNTTCYCYDPRFGYGLRDCSLQACGEAVYTSVLDYGSSVCAGMAFSNKFFLCIHNV
jgi:hypothetical protein